MTVEPLLIRAARDLDGVAGDVFCFDGVQQDPSAAAVFGDTEILDADGLIVAPGLLDLQVTGSGDIDLSAEPERLGEVGRELARQGVTAWLPTLVDPAPQVVEDMLGHLARARAHPDPWGAAPLGLHVEGPPADTRGWTRERGVRLVTLAPERPGAMTTIAELVDARVAVAVGASTADPSTVRAALDMGARLSTRLFHQMAPLGAREPGPAGTLLADPRTVLGIVCDGVQVAPEMLQIAWATLGPRRFWAVSNRITPLAQSVDVLRRTVGCSRAEAWEAASAQPARILGDPAHGRLAEGAGADLVLLDPGDLTVVATVVAGRVAHDLRHP